MKKVILILGVCLAPLSGANAQILDDLPEIDLPEFIESIDRRIDEAMEDAKDYSSLPPKAEKEARLKDLFRKLKKEEDPDSANLIAEEIWAIWLDSGSASVDLILRRATAADRVENDELARRLYDKVTTLAPDYAEGWARSGRLAFEEEDYNRAVIETTQALILEPRQFYALWTLGNLLESINRQDEALEVYRQAHELYPAMETIKSRVEFMESTISGDVL